MLQLSASGQLSAALSLLRSHPKCPILPFQVHRTSRHAQQIKKSGSLLKCSVKSASGSDAVETELLPTAKKWPTSPLFLFTVLAGFLGIIYDTFWEGGARWLLLNVDEPTHAWVVSHVPKIIRDLVFEMGISNISITLGCVGWAICTSLIIGDALDERKDTKQAKADPGKGAKALLLGPKNVARLTAAWVAYWTAGGFRAPGDNLLVHFFKYQFNRVRPSSRYKSFSFPSGHSASVTFIIGMVLFAFLPWILEIVDRRLKEKDTEAKLGVMKSPALQKLARSALKNATFLWPFSVITTASGRVLGDVHWVTDTVAGACLGASLVSLFLIVSTALDRQKPSTVDR